MAVSMKMAVFWVVAPCSLVEVYQRFRGPCRLHHQGDEWVGWCLVKKNEWVYILSILIVKSFGISNKLDGMED
jgi:hypothetical protein